jgi:hypothetical protein
MGSCIPADQHALGHYDMEVLCAGVQIESDALESSLHRWGDILYARGGQGTGEAKRQNEHFRYLRISLSTLGHPRRITGLYQILVLSLDDILLCSAVLQARPEATSVDLRHRTRPERTHR